MKKLLSAAMAMILLLTAISLPAAAKTASVSVWNDKKRAFALNEAPILTGVNTDLTENADGTAVFASYRAGAALTALFDAYEAADERADLMFARALGMDVADVEASLWLHVQFAYSLDGEHWVFDFTPESDAPGYLPARDFDRNGDGFYEYRKMPVYEMPMGQRIGGARVVNGRDDCFTAKKCDTARCSVKEAIRRCNSAMLQGKGQYLGSYYRAAADSGRGMRLDLRNGSVYVKARCRLYQLLERRVNGVWQEREESLTYSPWSEVYSYDLSARPPIPDASALRTDAAPTLEAVGYYPKTVTKGGVQTLATRYRMAVRFPEKTDAALADFYALQYDGELLEEIAGEKYDPFVFIEMRVGDGEWYYLTDLNAKKPYFVFDDSDATVQAQMGALGYKTGVPVYLRARLYGSDSWRASADKNTGYDRLLDRDPVHIATAPSAPVELSLNGVHAVRYEFTDPSVQAHFRNPNPAEHPLEEALALKPLEPKEKNYRFLGWFDNAAGAGDPVTAVAAGVPTGITLYAKAQKCLWGDLDFDGRVSTGDARKALRAAIGLEDLTEEQAAWADLDQHSAKHTITTGDARMVLRVAIALDTEATLGLPEIPKGF